MSLVARRGIGCRLLCSQTSPLTFLVGILPVVGVHNSRRNVEERWRLAALGLEIIRPRVGSWRWDRSCGYGPEARSCPSAGYPILIAESLPKHIHWHHANFKVRGSLGMALKLLATAALCAVASARDYANRPGNCGWSAPIASVAVYRAQFIHASSRPLPGPHQRSLQHYLQAC